MPPSTLDLDQGGILGRKRMRSTHDATLALLLVGGIVVFGWFIGVMRLWKATIWTTPEKILGTMIVPGGIAPALWIIFRRNPVLGHCFAGSASSQCGTIYSGPSWWAVLGVAMLFVLPIAMTAYLHVTANRRNRSMLQEH